MLPVAGGLARAPWLSRGNVASTVLGWSAWIAYVPAAPVETQVMLKYLGPQLPYIYAEGASASGENLDLSMAGYATVTAILVVMIVINAIGVRFFAAVNASLTRFKVGAPLFLASALPLNRFEPENSGAHGFAPYGVDGVLAAVANGAVIFAFVGFRHAVDMAGETRNPQRTIPIALGGSVLICWGVWILTVLGIAFFAWAVKLRLPDNIARSHIKTVLTAPGIEIGEELRTLAEQGAAQAESLKG